MACKRLGFTSWKLLLERTRGEGQSSKSSWTGDTWTGGRLGGAVFAMLGQGTLCAIQARASWVTRNPRGEPRGYLPSPLRGLRQARHPPIPSIPSILVPFSRLFLFVLFVLFVLFDPFVVPHLINLSVFSAYSVVLSSVASSKERVARSKKQPGVDARFQDARLKTGETAEASREASAISHRTSTIRYRLFLFVSLDPFVVRSDPSFPSHPSCARPSRLFTKARQTRTPGLTNRGRAQVERGTTIRI